MPLVHPTRDMLSAHAAGAASAGVALAVAARAACCAQCRAALGQAEAVSGALFATADGAAMTPGALAAVLARLDEAPARASTVPAPDPLLPAPVAALTGPFDQIRWRFLIPGVSRAEIASGGDESISLLRVRPGAGVPAHTHTGHEMTLVLSGALNDRGRVYGRGDLALASSDDDHNPRAEPGADCICLAVLTGSVRFTGRLGRALNLFAE